MSQHDLHAIICQQQEQLAAMQVQIQALLAAGGGGAGGEERRMTGPKVEVATPAIFNGETGKVGGFVTACRLYLRMKMREATVEEQVFWVLSHVQGGSADVWKENVLEELESGEMEYETAEEFLTTLKKEFGGGGGSKNIRQPPLSNDTEGQRSWTEIGGLQPLVWQRRQMPQQATMGPAPMEGIERTNTVVMRGQEFLQDRTPLRWT